MKMDIEKILDNAPKGAQRYNGRYAFKYLRKSRGGVEYYKNDRWVKHHHVTNGDTQWDEAVTIASLKSEAVSVVKLERDDNRTWYLHGDFDVTWGEVCLIANGWTLDLLIKHGAPVARPTVEAGRAVYTKEKHEDGELPPVGSHYLDEDSQLCVCIGYSVQKEFVIGQLVEHPSSFSYPPISTCAKLLAKPCKTEREKAVEDMMFYGCQSLTVKQAVELYDNGYRKEQVK